MSSASLLLALGVALLLLAAGLYRKLDFLLGALVGHAALILRFIGLLHLLVMLLERFLGGLAL